MARVTVEDCLEHVDSNYDLVLKASKRARDIVDGAVPLVDEDGDKPVVIALREIAEDAKPEALSTGEEIILDEDGSVIIQEAGAGEEVVDGESEVDAVEEVATEVVEEVKAEEAEG